MNRNPVCYQRPSSRALSTGVAAVALIVALSGADTAFAQSANLEDGINQAARSMESAGPADLLASVQAWEREDIRSALWHARKALRARLDEREEMIALYMMCVVQAEYGKPKRALPYCDRSVELGGERLWRSLNNRAHVRMMVGDLEGAVADYRAALPLADPEGESLAMTGRGTPASRKTVEANLALALSQLDDRTKFAGAAEGRLADPTGSQRVQDRPKSSDEAPPASPAH